MNKTALMEYKEANGLTVIGLSYELGIDASYLSKLLNGKRIPSWALAERISGMTGISVKALRDVCDYLPEASSNATNL